MVKAAFLDNPRGTIEDALRDTPFELLTGGSSVPNTLTRTSHAFTLHASIAGRTVPIGAAFGFMPSESRAVDEEFEVDANGDGLPVDLIPQQLNGRVITLERYDLYTKLIEEIFQTSPAELVMLVNQVRGFSLREVWRDPGGVFASTTRAYEYGNCWLTQKGRSMRADSNRVVVANASLVWGYRRRVI